MDNRHGLYRLLSMGEFVTSPVCDRCVDALARGTLYNCRQDASETTDYGHTCVTCGLPFMTGDKIFSLSPIEVKPMKRSKHDGKWLFDGIIWIDKQTGGNIYAFVAVIFVLSILALAAGLFIEASAVHVMRSGLK